MTDTKQPQKRGRRKGAGVTMADVAAAAGVSMQTVSRALRFPDTVTRENRKIIDEAIRKTHYVHNLAASHLASHKSNTVAAVIPTLSASLVPRFLGGPNGTLYGMSMAQQFGESGTWALGAAMGVVLFLFSAIALAILSFGVDLRRTGFTGLGRQ